MTSIADMAFLATKQLTKRFGGVHALDHIDVVFAPGAITALIGPNGSGKTTLVHTLTGLVRADSGTIEIDSAVLHSMRATDAAAYGITRTFQNSRLILQMSVLDNLLMVLTERPVWKALFVRHTTEHVQEAKRILLRIGLWEKRDDKVESLSYGQRKLLEIGRSLAADARIYLLDEPFAGLFPEMVKIVSEIARELRAKGAAVVLIEHDMALVRELADYCYVLDSGKILAAGSPEQVLAHPDVIDAYLGK